MAEIPTVTYTYPAKLERVVDGDTAVLIIDLGFNCSVTQPVRLKGYNAPELFGPNATKAHQAKAELQGLLAGRKLIIKTTKAFSQSFARYLAEVYYITDTGVYAVAEDMINKGYHVEQGQ
jgi:endonuclease YncB( thermonuclease family)